MRAALGAVEVGRGEGQVDVVDRHEQEARAVAPLVPAELEVLGAAQRHLRQQLLELAAELLALRRQLPVHQAGLALGALELLVGDLADDVVLGRAAGGEQLLDGASGEVDAGLGEHGVNNAAGAAELRATRRVVAQASAAQALLVLVVALLARLLVFGDQVGEAARELLQLGLGHLLGQVLVEVAVALGRDLLVHRHDGAAVLGVLDVVVLAARVLVFEGLAFDLVVFGVRHQSRVLRGIWVGHGLRRWGPVTVVYLLRFRDF